MSCSGTPAYLFEGQFPVGGGAAPPPPQWLQSQNRLASLVRDQVNQMAAREQAISAEGRNDEEAEGGRERTMQQLTQQLLNVMETVNDRNAGENMALSDEFVGLEEAIQATLQVTSASYFRLSNNPDYYMLACKCLYAVDDATFTMRSPL